MNLAAAPLLDNATNKDWWRVPSSIKSIPAAIKIAMAMASVILPVSFSASHIATLGVDAIWISPFFTSPMKDFGYDVSNYCDVDPMFGTLADFDAIITSAHRHGIRVMIDLVLSHTSDQHPWFKESRADRNNEKSDWYVWSDPKPDGTPPNNWLSIFGGSAWQWDGRREQYYLHNFLTSQPDLNMHNIEVQDALLDAAQFWLDRGVDGFRLDTINFYFHDQQLRDNPPLPPEERNANIAPSVNPYNHQNHLYDKNRPENLAFLRRFRAKMEPFGAAAVGEVGDAQFGLEILGQYTAGDELMQMCYAFEFLAQEQPDADRIVDVLQKVDEVASDGWACWAFSNHDVARHASRWNLNDAAQRMYATLIMCLRGSVCLYQGEELGLPEAEVNFEDLQDPYGIEFWPEYRGRDGCRTPMVWQNNNQNAGFSEGKPWLPVAPEHLAKSVEEQEKDPSALIHHYRKAIQFRQTHAALSMGEHSELKRVGSVVTFKRQFEGQVLLCAFNVSDEACLHQLPEGNWSPIGEELGCIQNINGNAINMGPWQVFIGQK